MTTAYTTLLGLALPVQGELQGTWGDEVNNYITNYLDAAVAGTQTISGSQTAVTLSKTTGSSLSQAGSGATGSSQYFVINCTGNPAGTLTITAPAASKAYLIINATSTTQDVKIVGAGPTTGVTLVSGERAIVSWNGSDFVKVANFGGVGSFTTISATTGNITTVNSTTVDTTNIEVTTLKAKDGTAAGSIADSTGVVTLASSVLTTADINGGTMDNVTIGGATPAAGNFTNLDATGTLAVDGNVTLGDASTDTVQVNGYMGVGGAANAAIAALVQSNALSGASQEGVRSSITSTSGATTAVRGFYARPTTAAAVFTATDLSGFYAANPTKGAGSTITNQHGVYIEDQTQGTNNYGITSAVSSGSNKWNIYASGTAANYFAGNVGIGSSSLFSWSSAYRHISNYFSTALFASVAGDAGVVSGAYFDGTNWLYTGNYVPSLYQFGPSLGRHSFSTAPTNASGVGATATFTERFRITNTEAVFNDPGNDYDFRVESDTNTHALFVDAGNSRVGIGTSAPGNTLDVRTDDATTNAVTRSLALSHTTTGTAANGIGSGIIFQQESSTGSLRASAYIDSIFTDATDASLASALTFTTRSGGSLTERLRIDSSGNVQTLTGANVVWAPAPASISTTATLTNANIQAQIINTTGTSYTVTMPLGTTLETLVSWTTTDLGYDFSVINTASGTITMAANTGVTTLGTLTIATGTSAQFRIRRTAANTFILYRLS